ncbi:MAG: type III pantothenate kinase [Candidatus Nitronauta litoralis]|uniref:Type III pantothenate kinase n=1 Tax=Candidatus Nitronauta litoralis TaxID=2705533 RepID=A0A7T0BX50_9BACT|nr:MAG: type III pantothenate kinase [Candidatus Nitronauta litoralis]
MLLAVDIGNTNIVFGLFREKKLLMHWRIRTELNRTTDEYWVLVQEFIRLNSADPETIDALILSCVVPPLVPVFEELSLKFFGTKALVVGPGVKTGIPILYKNPVEVGADRIVNAVAGFEKYGGPLILVDFGTATTFDAVSAQGEYLGGAIAPGLRISLEALFRNTAKLSPVDLAVPEYVIGRSTMESIQSGTVYGFVGMIDSIVYRMQKEMKSKARVIGTGGLIGVIAEQVESIEEVDDFLTLEGLSLIYERNRK